uniref:Uncharacterized protein n=1 Tax=Ascaris lumbricoides TaxID=6252 RepID=A0A0M3IM56_ASCLU
MSFIVTQEPMIWIQLDGEEPMIWIQLDRIINAIYRDTRTDDLDPTRRLIMINYSLLTTTDIWIQLDGK